MDIQEDIRSAVRLIKVDICSPLNKNIPPPFKDLKVATPKCHQARNGAALALSLGVLQRHGALIMSTLSKDVLSQKMLTRSISRILKKFDVANLLFLIMLILILKLW